MNIIEKEENITIGQCLVIVAATVLCVFGGLALTAALVG